MTAGATPVSGHAHAARVHVRPATDEDLPDLLLLWDELRRTGGRSTRDALHVAVEDIGERLHHALDDPDCRVIVATYGDDVLGMAVLTQTSLGPLSSVSAAQLSHVVVADGHRRHGVGHALLAAATTFADEVGAEHVLVGVSPALRDANRFYARLGFSPVVVRRMASVQALRRRLTDGEHPVAALEELTRRRLIARPRLTRSRSRFPVG
jgi:GNAT superfamily N-acetyltransferase